MKSIVTLTLNPAIDVNTGVGQMVADRKLRCRPPRYEAGGGGINVSRAIHRLGGHSLALHTAGGPFGGLLQDLLNREGVSHRPIPIGGWTRQSLVILEDAGGRQFRLGLPGPNLRESEWKAVLQALSTLDPKPDYLAASGSLPPGVPEDFYARLVHRAGEDGTRVIVDTSGPPLRLALEAGGYLLKPNLNELKQLLGREINDETELKQAALELVRQGPGRVLVVSLGAGGALLVSGDGSELVRSPTVPIKSRVGAGDSMVAGLLKGLAEGRSLREAVRLGVAAGGAAVMTPGTELCRRQDTERLFRQMTGDLQTGPQKDIDETGPAS